VQTAIEPSSSKKSVRSADLRAAQKAVERSEQAMLDAQANIESIAERLGDSRLYEPTASDELAAILQQQKQAQEAMEQAESTWLAATEALEALTA
jgi:ATP-binding cassette subfamily F protein 3